MSIMQNKIPEDYFKKFPKKLNEKILRLEDEIKTNAPTLDSIGKQNPYLVPEGFFEAWSFKKPHSKNSIISIRFVSGIAATLILLVGVFLSTKTFNDSVSDNAFAEIDEQELINYISQNIDDFDDDLFSDLTLEAETNFTNISTTDLEYYIDQDLDIDLFYLKDL